MLRVRVTAAFLMLALAGGVMSQDKDAPTKDKPKDKPDEKKFKGYLPSGFKKLGLTDKQIQAVYKVQNDYRPRIDDLKRQIEKLKDAEKDEVEKVLTDEQRKRLREIRTGEKTGK